MLAKFGRKLRFSASELTEKVDHMHRAIFQLKSLEVLIERVLGGLA
jgi:hypothetical protein